ncbi:MAG: DUF2804 domain-containing protein [Treponemataceae bacterium]
MRFFLYTRKFISTPKNIIKYHQPAFGTFKEPFSKLDIKGLKSPFGGIPLPLFLTNLRITASTSFAFSTENYFGTIDIFDAKFFALSDLVIWNAQTQKKYVFRKMFFPRKRLIPLSLEKGVCTNHNSKQYFRLEWNRELGELLVLINFEKTAVRPKINLSFSINLHDAKTGSLMSVLPALVTRRCFASFQTTGGITGFVDIEGARIPQQGVAFFEINRLYTTLRTKIKVVIGEGLVNGKQVSFKLSATSFSASDELTYNDNALFVDGKTWPLPPVRITSFQGISKPWVIQDTESMVDLTFTPLSVSSHKLSAFFVHRNFHLLYGTFEGVLLTSEGESLFIKSFTGIAKHLRYRL